ncbi:hypothetical protein [Streptosporangium sp. NPDC049644]|uniref:hypothetical protein n=1 Tax=Streptosporangium sp. NPDC049644 TaxID=3155507 RepID=UPI00341EDA02
MGGGGAEFTEDRVNQWLGVYQANLLYAQERGRGEDRRIWARVAFAALDGLERAGCPARDVNTRRFNLRALLITDPGPNGDPLWSPEQLAVDVLRNLPLSLEQAREWAADWTARPRHEMQALRTCKSLIKPMELVAGLRPRPLFRIAAPEPAVPKKVGPPGLLTGGTRWAANGTGGRTTRTLRCRTGSSPGRWRERGRVFDT